MKGVWPILYAFFDEQERLDRGAMRAQVEACIRGGAHGIAVLGLVTEFHKLTLVERRTIIDWVLEDVGGRLPVAVTVNEAGVAAAREVAQAAQAAGAAWLILQPPQIAGMSEAALVRFMGALAEAVSIPCGPQNNPSMMDVALSAGALMTLHRAHPHFRMMKGEGPILYVKRLIEETEGVFSLFNGLAGLELTDTFRIGCAGMIPAPDVADVQARIWDLMAAGEEEAAESLHRSVLPIATFMMMPRTAEHFAAYGKPFFAKRAGIAPPHGRRPCVDPHPLGAEILERLGRRLPSLAG
ncbi:dihydrodipicolinate synthase family protein [Roseomonas sp. CECT 9278]|uniref:dihydrodipicolinate synthase family protein n=1 Tax=Roseomonas sp. CECT 9278 TaxID=2845823 RepID=UPI001E4130C1|nr:dihydrodipicolinate synthase family protein [Roseomonas sp. CECT 9278]CAH0266821.1 Putative 2-dehydro-3-deoxy-D-gluconate aldolase YagE [Roseomonas sp. CECT 9278]